MKRRVWIGGLFAVLAVGGWIFWTERSQTASLTRPADRQPFVRLAGSSGEAQDAVLREKADLLDPTPLFFPTEHNFGQRPLREDRLKQPGQVFGSFDPKFAISSGGLSLYGQEVANVPEKLSDVLTSGDEAPFDGFGRYDRDRFALPVRSGFLEVRDALNGNVVINQSLAGLSMPRTDASPVEFLVVVSPAGMVGEPFLVSGSEWDEVDSYLRNYLIKTYRLGERLLPGSYRVSIGA